MTTERARAIFELGHRAYQLRSAGMTVQQVARQLECSHWRICQALNVYERRRFGGRSDVAGNAPLGPG